MRKIALCAVALLCVATLAYAAIPVMVDPNQQAALSSGDARLDANKKLVSEYWRTVFMARRVDQAPRFLTKDFQEHAPTMPEPGLAGFMKFFAKWGEKPLPVIPEEIKGFVSIVAEGDLVVLATVQNVKDSEGKLYTTTWFDMFRIREGKVSEHWDNQRFPDSTVVLGFDNSGAGPVPE